MQKRFANSALGIFNYGDISIEINGRTDHSTYEIRQFAESLAELFGYAGINGAFKVKAGPYRLKGTKSLQGLSVQTINRNDVVLGYQPGSNDTRLRYSLSTTPDETKKIHAALKSVITGAAYLPLGKTNKVEPVVEVAEEVMLTTSFALATPFVKATEKPKLYYTADTEWMETFVLYLIESAEAQPNHLLSKKQVFDMIVKHTHLENHFGVGPISHVLKCRGYLVAVAGQCDMFTVVGSPDPVTVKRSFAAAPLASVKGRIAKKAPQLKQTPIKCLYLSDELWVAECMKGLSDLVNAKSGLVTQTAVLKFIQQKTDSAHTFGAVGSVLRGLKIRGLLITTGEKQYRVSYEPRPDTATKAVEIIKKSRADTEALFGGFAKYKLPKFAEGMFSDLRILDDFLAVVLGGEISSAILSKRIEERFPCSFRSSRFQLLAYLVGRGYLLRSKTGYYSLGPVGCGRLGLPSVTYATVEKPLSVTGDTQPLVVVTQPEIDTGVTEAMARALQKASAKKTEADAEALIETQLTARRDELRSLQSTRPTPEQVEVSVMARLVAMANDL